jgi:hypothetical protein
MDFVARPWLSGDMRYRIEMSQSRNGYARVNFPGRILALEANRHIGPVWLVGIVDLAGDAHGLVAVRAGSAGEAVWRVARAAVRAVAEITGSPDRNTVESGSEG